MLERGLALKVLDLVCGQSTQDSLANYDPDSSSWKTHQACLVSGWEMFSETWSRSGMMLCGTAFQLAPLAPIMSATACGLLPTPTATDFKSESMSPELVAKRQAASTRGVGISEQLHRMRLPTPMAGNNHWNHRLDELGGSTNPFRGTAIGKLPINPCWTEARMGFPTDWTAIDPSETPLSRKSRKSSAAPS